MELRHLKMIQAVAKVGTLSQASKQLNLTQSALSHQLREIEEELETPLFHRMNKKLVLSHAGQIMLETASSVLNKLEEARQEIRKELCGDMGTINLSTQCYTCYHWLPSVLKTFALHQEKIKLNILPEYTREPIPALLNGELDLVITNLMGESDKIAYRELFWDEQLVVVGEDHPWALKPFISAEDFAEENLIIYYGPIEESALYQKVLAPKNIKPKNVIEMQLTEAAIEMIKSGLGIKVMAAWAIKPYLKDHPIKTIPITKSRLYRTWYLAYLRAAGWKDYYDTFWSHLVASMKGESI
ncbi:MAG: LysR family transcriptional regulator [Saprospiraceae bacterium]|nr:LysR family transcriptional regulator [Saprospiraceae bacterium]